MREVPGLISITVPLGDPPDNAAKVMGRLLLSDPESPAQILHTATAPPFPLPPQIRLSGSPGTTLPLPLKKCLFLLRLPLIRGRALQTLISPRPAVDPVLRRLAKRFSGRVIQTVPVVADERTFDPGAYFGRIIVVFSRHSQRLLRARGLSDVRVAPVPCNTDIFRPRPMPDLQEPRILLSEEFSRPETFETLIRTAAKIHRKIPKARFVLAARKKERADRSKRHTVLQAIRRSGLQSSFEMHETVLDMPGLLGSCHVTVYPVSRMSNKLDIPLFLLEGLAMGRPAVLPDVPPLNEIRPISPGKEDRCATSVPPGDPEALADALVFLLNDPNRLESAGRDGINLIREHHRIGDFQAFFRGLAREVAA